MKNKRVKRELFRVGLSQARFAKILGITEAELSNILKYELAVKEQNNLVAAIREYETLAKGADENGEA